jgi:DNA-binding transcriptional LysR family regulator
MNLMNIHYLELFYHVAHHGGISRAVRHMPYGIQQPAVSSQILLLEQDLGTKLFERTPFKLTKEGDELYAFVRPFFEGLDEMAARLREKSAPLLRLGAAEFVLRDYLAPVIKQLHTRHANVQLCLRSGFSQELEQWLLDGTIDLAITPWDGRPASGLRFQRLVRLPLALLVPRSSSIRSADELWAQDRITTALIRLPVKETITRLFLKGLKKLSVDWPLVIEASSVDLITQYVANNYGIGLTVNVPELVKKAKVRVLPLDNFEPVEIVAMWRGEASPLIETVLAEVRTQVTQRWPQWQCA